LLQGDFDRVFPNAFCTVILARLPDKRYQLYRLDGTLLHQNFFYNYRTDGGESLPEGYFVLSDAADKFALFDPFGERLTPHRYMYFKKASEENLRIATEKDYLKPGRTLVALGMTEIPERKVIGWHWLDDTGAVVHE
jgi:hypothetical protein